MAAFTKRLLLKYFTIADQYDVADYTANMQAIDAAPGITICTSTTHPSTWGTDQAGMAIYETDTKRRQIWNGTAFELLDPRGLVTRAERLNDITTTSTTYVPVVSTTATTYTNRRHLVIAEAPGVYNTNGLTGMALYRDTTLLQEWQHQGWTGATPDKQPRPLSFVTTDQWAGGSAVYSLQFEAVIGFGGSSTILGGTNKPIALSIVEV